MWGIKRSSRAVMFLALLVGLCAFAGSSFASPTTAKKTGCSAITPVTVDASGSAVPYYAPLYIADHRGYFKQHCLQVSFTYDPNDTNIIENVASGNIQFGFPNGDSVIPAIAQNVKVDVVDTTYQAGIGALMFLSSSGIQSPADLKGKTVGVTSIGSPNYIQLEAMLASVNLSLNDINLQVIPTATIVPALENGSVQAIVFSRLRYYAMLDAGFSVGQILSDKYLPSYGNVLITSPSYLKKNPAVVAGFIAALHQSIDWISQGHAYGAANFSINTYAQSFAGQTQQIADVINSVYIPTLWHSGQTYLHGLGYANMARWQADINAQAQYGLIPKAFPASLFVIQPASLLPKNTPLADQ
jgi:NitT/TauT family transport system substrate-binding protein